MKTTGTTSACAENTHLVAELVREPGNYLRVRGEYSQPLLMASPMMELPPRARRIQLTSGFVVLAFGTTSACAENTKALVFLHPSDRNYLRVRGEYPRESCRLTSAWELPPRARRILPRLGRAFGIPGTTSACAENTLTGGRFGRHFGNYLRVRGEYNNIDDDEGNVLELPPRARRIPLEHTAGHILAGTTSACAENTRKLFA